MPAKRLFVTVDEAIHDVVTELAAAGNVNASDIVRSAIDEYLRKRDVYPTDPVTAIKRNRRGTGRNRPKYQRRTYNPPA